MDSMTRPMTETSPYAVHGPRLVDQGYVALPCRPGSKVPGTWHVTPKGEGYWINMMRWSQDYQHRLPTEEEMETFGRWPGAPGVNLLTGRAGGARLGVVVFDLDADPAKMSDAQDIHDAILAVLPPTQVGKAGAKGESLFYHLPEGLDLPSRSFNIRGLRVLDVLSDGRQTVLPPTVHPDTRRPYVWSRSETLERLAVDELPPISPDVLQDIERVLLPFGYEQRHNPAPRALVAPGESSGNHFRDLNEHALRNLDAWVPRLGDFFRRRGAGAYEAIPYWRPSRSGRPLPERDYSFSITAQGARDFGDDRGFSAIDVVMAAQACDLDTAVTFLARSTGWAGDVPDVPVATIVPVSMALPPPPAAPVVVEVVKAAGVPRTKAPVEDLTRCPGLVGDIVDWIESSAQSPSRELALGAAVAVVGTLCGRRWVGPTRSGTHMFIALIGPTASGKDWPLVAADLLMNAAAAGHHLGSDEYMSGSAAINEMKERPLMLSCIDELGVMLKRMNNRNASTHEQLLSKWLRSIWGRSGQTWRSPAWAGKKPVTVHAPAVSILGASTIIEIMESFAAQDATNGLMNRFLLLEQVGYPDLVKPKAATTVPMLLGDSLQALYESDGVEGTVGLNIASMRPELQAVPWADAGVEEAYEAMGLEIRNAMIGDPDMEAFLGRTREMAVRLATIRALGIAGRDFCAGEELRPQVTMADFEWGRAVAMRSARVMYARTAKLLGQTEIQKIANRVLEVVGAKPEGMGHRELHRKLGQKWPSKTFADVIKGLSADAEQLEITKVIQGDRVVQWYRVVE